jgi:hypothetical protein
MTEATPAPLPNPERRSRPARISDQGIRDLTATLLTLGALVVVGVLALRGSEAALGALIGILSAATGYLLRAKVSEAKGS